jgi:SAM-dependent methyltransferase
MKQKRKPAPDLETLIPLLLNIWRRFRQEPGPADRLQTREFRNIVAKIKILQEMSMEGKSLIGTDYFQDPELLGAYLLYQWVVHYQEGLSLINEIPITPRRVLDICSGPAPFAFAALRHGAQDVIAADRNMAALQLGADVCGRYGMPMTIRRWNCLEAPLPVEGKFDLIILAHCLQELFPAGQAQWQERQDKFIQQMLQRLSPDGFLLIADSSFGEANRRILTLRERMVKQNVPVQAPCVWQGNCPALEAESQCYAQREFEKPYLIKELQRAADINLSSLKMSYLILRNPQAGWPKLPLKRLYRIISPPIEAHHGKRFYLCGVDGKKTLSSHLEATPKSAKAFDFIKRGELIAIENALEKGNELYIVKDTQLVIEAAAGKPIPEENEENADS